MSLSFEDYEGTGGVYMSAKDLVEVMHAAGKPPNRFQKLVTIRCFEEHEFEDYNDRSKLVKKLVAFFDETDKGLSLGKLNIKVLKDLGGTPDGCIGKQVEIYLDTCQVGESGYMLRIRPPAIEEDDEIPF